MRTPMGCCASTFPKAPTSACTAPRRLQPWRPPSTPAPERRLGGKHLPRPLISCFGQPTNIMLRRPLESAQFTSVAVTSLLRDNAIAISRDGKGAWRDNVFVERIWRSVKYEEVDLRAYDSVAEAKASIGRYLAFYNSKRPHSSLDARTPDRAYLDHLPQVAAAA